jgi:ferredoxin
MDPRFGARFQWLQGPARALPVAECLDGEVPDDAAAVVSVVDEGDRVRELTVEQAVLEQSRRCRHAWRALRQLARGPAPQARTQPEVVEAPAAAPAVAPAAVPASPAPAADAKASPDEAYIETPRCTTCNECTQINPRMFAYDANKQAHIADVTAGTYRQLVEAAESCQVSIIHPGKPRDPGEAGLEELLERAAPFL